MTKSGASCSIYDLEVPRLKDARVRLAAWRQRARGVESRQPARPGCPRAPSSFCVRLAAGKRSVGRGAALLPPACANLCAPAGEGPGPNPKERMFSNTFSYWRAESSACTRLAASGTVSVDRLSRVSPRMPSMLSIWFST